MRMRGCPQGVSLYEPPVLRDRKKIGALPQRKALLSGSAASVTRASPAHSDMVICLIISRSHVRTLERVCVYMYA